MTKTNDTGWVTQTLNNHNADWNMDICKMKKKYYMITVALFAILCSGCSLRSSISHDPSKVQFIKEMSRMYDKNIIDFFPSDATNGNDWGSFYSSSWDDSVESIFRCCAYFSTNVSAAILDSIEKEEYVVKMDYSDSLFSIDVPYMRHAESYLNPMKDSLQIPIANMRYAYFSLGETIDTVVTDDRYFVVESEVVPQDLVIYVFEAGKGNFWKNRDKAAREERPVLLEPWKHGYVKGVAVSRELSRVCWWAIAW